MKSHVKQSLTVMWLCQIPSRFCFYVRNRRVLRVCLVLVLVFLYCELIHYYVVLMWCTWPKVLRAASLTSAQHPDKDKPPLRAMFIGDTHILGSNAHWFDRLRREWQMVRSFQASMLIHSPDVVFILGDFLDSSKDCSPEEYRYHVVRFKMFLFARSGTTLIAQVICQWSGLNAACDLLDNGKDCSPEEYRYHVARFKKMFATPASTRMEVLVGNHDVGFHYRMTERRHQMFVEGFDSPSVRLLQMGELVFVLINSMALEGDGCTICRQAEDALREIKWKLKCAKGQSEGKTVAAICDKTTESFAFTRPIILQHFPMYRASDSNCSTPDAPPDEEKDIPFRPMMDCLSEDSSKMLLEWLDPRLIISAHTHHGCYRLHENGAPEYTVASYNWRNKPGPTFLLAEISGDRFAINRCYLPNEYTVFCLYGVGAVVMAILLLMPMKSLKRVPSVEQIMANKWH